MVSYRVMLDVPAELVRFVSGLLAAHRRQIGTRKGTRRLGCYKQALFGLAWFRDKGDIPRLGRGFGLPQSTAYRYLDEVIEVLAARAPGLQEALERALSARAPYLILDGKVVDTDRCREKTTSRKTPQGLSCQVGLVQATQGLRVMASISATTLARGRRVLPRARPASRSSETPARCSCSQYVKVASEGRGSARCCFTSGSVGIENRASHHVQPLRAVAGPQRPRSPGTCRPSPDELATTPESQTGP